MNLTTSTEIAGRFRVTTDDQDIIQFVRLFAEGVAAWIEAGKLVVRRMDADSSFVEKFTEACPDIPVEVLLRFESIGRRKLYPHLLVVESPAVNRLIRLPYEVQEKCFNSPVEVLVKTDNGWESLLVDIRNLSPQQAQQVFAKDGVRSSAAQRAYLETKAARSYKPVDVDKPWRVVGNSLVVTKSTKLTAKELVFILSQMDV